MALEVYIPRGWHVTAVSNAGTWDASHQEIKWGPFFDDLTRVVRFSARSAGSKATLEGFAGTVSFDGFNEPVIFAPSWGD